MSETKDGGPAFPCPDMVQRDAAGARFGTPVASAGMSLRDWFAGQALAGYFSNPHTPHQNATDCAAYIYQMADAMLAARTEGGADNG